MSENGSGTRVPRCGPFLVLIVGLPREYTWRDLKDLIRPKATHSIWTDVSVVTYGEHSYSRHSIRLGVWSEARSSYTHICQQIIADTPPFVELWDISEAPAILVQRNFDLAHGSMQTQPREVDRLAQGDSWVQLVPNFPHHTMMQGTMSGQMQPTPMARPQPYAGQAVPGNYIAQQYTPAQLAQYQAYHAGQSHFRQPSIQQQPVQATTYGTTASGLPVNTRNGAVIVEPRAVFVQGLSYKARESEIQALFNTAGKVVSCKLQVDPRTRKSKGCAKIEYDSTQEAELAIYHCHGKKWMGRELSVRLDRDTTVVTPPTPAADQRPLIVDGSSGGRSRSRN